MEGWAGFEPYGAVETGKKASGAMILKAAVSDGLPAENRRPKEGRRRMNNGIYGNP